MTSIENICGNQPDGFVKLDISSDPNFVFVNDPRYSTKQLFDEDGNTVFVNSYTECVHYVSGGWDYTPVKNTELQFQNNLTYLVIVLLIFTFFKRNIFSLKFK
jgi:hypothetical protein